MMDMDAFIERFNGYTEPYWFYNNTVELRYEPKEHIYYLVMPNGDFVPQDGVTSALHIIDKSDALIPWGCKMMSAKLLANTPVMELPTGEKIVPQMSYADFEALVLGSKNAHKEKLEEAAGIGHQAHNWIEHYIIEQIKFGKDCVPPLKHWPQDPRAQNCCDAAVKWMKAHNVRWISTERKIYSRVYGYAGTMDGLCTVDSCSDPICCPEAFKDRLSVADWKSSNYLYVEYILQTAAYQNAYEEEHGVTIADRWIIRLGKDDGEFDPWHFAGRKLYSDDFERFVNCLYLYRAIRDLKVRVKEQSNIIKAALKERALAEREATLKIKCKGADKYKGIRPPRCNKGNPCQSCLAKYQANHPSPVAS